jgi:hypothetical protein
MIEDLPDTPLSLSTSGYRIEPPNNNNVDCLLR